MAAPADFLGDIPDFDHMSDRLRLGYERAAACPADDDTRRLQLAKRPVCRHARDVELLDEIRFRRHTIAWLQAAVANGVVDALFDCCITWRRIDRKSTRMNSSHSCATRM